MSTDHPIINASDHDWNDGLYLMWAGAHGDTKGYVWAGSAESAFETWVEYLDDHAPGCLFSHEQMRDALNAAAKDHGFESIDAAMDCVDDTIEAIVQDAELDLTIIGHTSLDNGCAIPSWEWGFAEIDPGTEDYAEVKRLSKQED